MARNFPADYQKQKFLEESYNKERDTRLAWYLRQNKDNSDTGTKSKQYQVFRKKIERHAAKPGEDLLAKLPEVRAPKQYHKKKPEYSQTMAELAAVHGRGASAAAADNRSVEMWKVDNQTKSQLYQGFSKEGTGRYQYLQKRYQLIPESKYTFPILSSWEYGWRLSDVIKKEDIKKPVNGRTRIVADTFYTRTGIPTLVKANTFA